MHKHTTRWLKGPYHANRFRSQDTTLAVTVPGHNNVTWTIIKEKKNLKCSSNADYYFTAADSRFELKFSGETEEKKTRGCYAGSYADDVDSD